jgi:DNA-binding CsgD family transcriptional regulator
MTIHIEDSIALLPHGRNDSNPRDLNITERQLECLAWTQEGKSATDIGLILGISGRTVEGHLAKVCEHLGVRTRIQAVIKAKDLGFLRRPKP